MKTQTSIDWLAEQNDLAIMHFLSKINHPAIEAEAAKAAGELGLIIKTSLQTARKMHREEVVNSFTKGQLDIIEVIMPIPDEIKVDTKDGENYYSQTFETP